MSEEEDKKIFLKTAEECKAYAEEINKGVMVVGGQNIQQLEILVE